ncbi:hypothetical protein JTB14_002855 [Gonioctena quinquepunctata]|nr:hypothetical protein JTB14_002855 [Gonioctena quinquepunctata]
MSVNKYLKDELDILNKGYQELKQEMVQIRETNIELIHIMAPRRLPELKTTYAAVAKTDLFAPPAKIQSEFERQPCTTLTKNSSTQPLDKVPSSPVKTTTEDGFKEIRRRTKNKTAQRFLDNPRTRHPKESTAEDNSFFPVLKEMSHKMQPANDDNGPGDKQGAP